MSVHDYGRPLDAVHDALDRHGCQPRGPGDQLTARCPAHDDRNASLSVGTGHDGRALLTCHAGCPTLDVLAALGLDWSDLFPGDSAKPWTLDALRRTGARMEHDGRVRLGGTRYLPGAPDGARKALADNGSSRDLWPDPATVTGVTFRTRLATRFVSDSGTRRVAA